MRGRGAPQQRHFGQQARTAKDRERDLIHFLHTARPEKVAEMSADALAERYGVKLAVARQHHAAAVGPVS